MTSELSEEQRTVLRVLSSIQNSFNWRYKDIEEEIQRDVNINPEYALSRRALLDELARMHDEVMNGVCLNYSINRLPPIKRRLMSFKVVFESEEETKLVQASPEKEGPLLRYVSSSMQLRVSLVSIGRAKSGKINLAYSSRLPSMLPSIRTQMIHEVLAGVDVKLTDLRDATHFELMRNLFEAKSISAIIRSTDHMLRNHPKHLVWEPHPNIIDVVSHT
jgi:hypothetical protein